jgi:hypothetical protein
MKSEEIKQNVVLKLKVHGKKFILRGTLLFDGRRNIVVKL